MKMNETGVAVFDKRGYKPIWFIACPGEKRVRIDVHDSLENYAVYEVVYTSENHFDVVDSQSVLDDWEISYS